jgi:hypothetical protein
MSFRKLQDNLIQVLRERVHNGEISERRLAKITGVSQPHIHNVLKGVRELSPGLSDRILQEFRLSVRDLWGDDARVDWGIPIVQDPVGPGHRFPRECYGGSHPFSLEVKDRWTHPVVFRLVRDPQMEPDLLEKDMVLVDRAQAVRRTPDAHSLYLVEFAGWGLVRYVRREDAGIYLAATGTPGTPGPWRRADLDGRDILEVIRGRIVWIGRQMETPAGFVDQAGPAVGSAGGAGSEDRGGDGPGGLGAPAGGPDAACDLR